MNFGSVDSIRREYSMLKVVEIGLSPIFCLLYKKDFIDIDHFLAPRTVLLDASCILGHIWPVITLSLYSHVKVYGVVSTGIMNSIEFFFRSSSDMARAKMPPLS